MPNIKSAKKRMRQNAKRREANRQKKSAVRTFEKKVRAAIAEKKFDEADKVYQTFSSKIDKAAKTNIVHKNAASRKKSRLALAIKKARTIAVPA